MSEKCLLAVLAHPDDESFGPGGTLAKYAAAGVDVHIAIATDGAAGSVVEGFEKQREQLAEVRGRELETAVAILGATLHTLGYRDSGYLGDPANEHPDALIQADEQEATGRVVALIRKVKPDVVLTHDETGGYGHPDHIYCWKITRAAFDAAADPTQYPHIGPGPHRASRLYCSAIPKRWVKVATFIMRLRGQDPTHVGRNRDIDLTKVGVDPGLITTTIDINPVWEKKQAAGAAHSSQGGGGFGRMFPLFLRKRLLGREHFIRLQPPVTPGDRRESGFF